MFQINSNLINNPKIPKINNFNNNNNFSIKINTNNKIIKINFITEIALNFFNN